MSTNSTQQKDLPTYVHVQHYDTFKQFRLAYNFAWKKSLKLKASRRSQKGIGNNERMALPDAS